jgi:hypothetical protein
MGNPFISQGTLNRLRGQVVYADFPALNVTAPYLSRSAISLAFDGDTSQLLGTLTGGVTSPEPYTYGTVTMHLLRSQGLADAYKQQIETDTTLGSVDIIGDSDQLGTYELENCVLLNVQEMAFDGNEPSMIIRLRGLYYINSGLFADT